jgi:two-component system C4-dicarboxylate transport response regulator DctD
MWLHRGEQVDLKAESDAGRFRTDLYFRLATVELSVPPLRERREDVPLLLDLFADRAARRFGVAVPAHGLSVDALGSDWPRNVRELKAAAERAVLGMDRKWTGQGPSRESRALPDRVAAYEAMVIEEALRHCGGSTARAAETLGLARRTLNEKIARYGLRANVDA